MTTVAGLSPVCRTAERLSFSICRVINNNKTQSSNSGRARLSTTLVIGLKWEARAKKDKILARERDDNSNIRRWRFPQKGVHDVGRPTTCLSPGVAISYIHFRGRLFRAARGHLSVEFAGSTRPGGGESFGDGSRSHALAR